MTGPGHCSLFVPELELEALCQVTPTLVQLQNGWRYCKPTVCCRLSPCSLFRILFGSLELWGWFLLFLRGIRIPTSLPNRCGNRSLTLHLLPYISVPAAAACSAPSRALCSEDLAGPENVGASGLLWGTHGRGATPPISLCGSAGAQYRV